MEVDVSLADPPVREESESDGGVGVIGLLDENAPVAALGLFALAVALSSATLSDSLAVLFGALAVLGSIAAAVYLLFRQG